MADFKWLYRNILLIFIVSGVLGCHAEELESESDSSTDPDTSIQMKSLNIQTPNSATEGGSQIFESGDIHIFSTASLGVNAYRAIDPNGGEVYADALHFSYIPIDSEYQLVAKVNAISATKNKSRVGLTVRSGLDNNDTFAGLFVSDSGKLKFISRQKEAHKARDLESDTVAFPFWMKVIRKGPYIRAYYSQDNLDWHLAGEKSIASQERVYIGASAFSGDPAALVEAEFSDFSHSVPFQFDNNGGVYQLPVTVSLLHRQEAASYYYTTDGSQPDTNSEVFVEPLTIGQDTTLKVSEYIGGIAQDTLSAYYVFKDSDEDVDYRPLHFSYGGVGGTKRLVQSDDEILQALMTAFPNKPTLLTPVILNEDPALFEPFISKVQQIVPSIYLGVGFAGRHSTPTVFPKDYDQVIELAKKFRVYSDAIRIEAFDNILEHSGDSQMDGEAYMVQLLEELHEMGFNKIMANPWVPRPYDPEAGEPYEQWPHLTSVFIGTGSVEWVAPVGRINKVYRHNPALNVIVNYENAPRHIELTEIETAYQKGEAESGSIEIMGELVGRQRLKDTLKESDPEIDHYFKWSAPWSHNYDPLALGTVEWLGETLADLNP